MVDVYTLYARNASVVTKAVYPETEAEAEASGFESEVEAVAFETEAKTEAVNPKTEAEVARQYLQY